MKYHEHHHILSFKLLVELWLIVPAKKRHLAKPGQELLISSVLKCRPYTRVDIISGQQQSATQEDKSCVKFNRHCNALLLRKSGQVLPGFVTTIY